MLFLCDIMNAEVIVMCFKWFKKKNEKPAEKPLMKHEEEVSRPEVKPVPQPVPQPHVAVQPAAPVTVKEPVPVAKPEPLKETPKPEPVKVEPAKEAPKAEPVKPAPVKVEPAKPAPVAKPEPIKEVPKAEPVKPAPIKVEPPKAEPVKPAPIKVEPPKAPEKPVVKPEPLKEVPAPEKTDTRYAGKYEIFAEGESFRFRLKASNGEVLLVSQGYASKSGAASGIETFKKNVAGGKFEVYTDKNNNSQFMLKSLSNGRIIASGEAYDSKTRCESAIESVKRFYATEKIETV
jgi:uncharacterized protein YegP (UPF0339 family)